MGEDDGSGILTKRLIKYGELIFMLKNDITDKRRAVINHAFNNLDAQAKNFIDFDHLLNNFNPHCHPRVRIMHKNTL